METKKDILVKVEGLSKKFCKDLKTSLWYGLKDIFLNIKGNTTASTLREKEFWAVQNINFELKRGECLGLIGHNGAGKSTLLKILNGLINPDEGKVTISGRVGALIELGAGFNPILSGRENIYNNGAILGFKKAEIDSKIQEIIDFSEIEEFIDMPVQNYSSGMKVRLGFAIAAQMEPDVLIIDEVLAVGDLGFVLKCFQQIDKILPNTAMIFVSHNMPLVSRICTSVMLLEKGQPTYQGNNVSKAIDMYYSRFANNKSNIIFDNHSLAIESILINETFEENKLVEIKWKEDIKIKLVLVLFKAMAIPSLSVSIFDKEQRPVALLQPEIKSKFINDTNKKIEITITHKNLQLSKGLYSINVSLNEANTKKIVLRVNGLLKFQIIHEQEIWPSFFLDSDAKLIEL